MNARITRSLKRARGAGECILGDRSLADAASSSKDCAGPRVGLRDPDGRRLMCSCLRRGFDVPEGSGVVIGLYGGGHHSEQRDPSNKYPEPRSCTEIEDISFFPRDGPAGRPFEVASLARKHQCAHKVTIR